MTGAVTQGSAFTSGQEQCYVKITPPRPPAAPPSPTPPPSAVPSPPPSASPSPPAHILVTVDDGAGASFNAVVTDNTAEQVTFTGSHTLYEGDVVRFYPVRYHVEGDTDCSVLPAGVFGGVLDAALTTSVQLPANADTYNPGESGGGDSGGLNGEAACEGHGYDSAACASVGCCHYNSVDGKPFEGSEAISPMLTLSLTLHAYRAQVSAGRPWAVGHAAVAGVFQDGL